MRLLLNLANVKFKLENISLKVGKMFFNKWKQCVSSSNSACKLLTEFHEHKRPSELSGGVFSEKTDFCFFLFLMIKETLKKTHFNDIDDIKSNTTLALNILLYIYIYIYIIIKGLIWKRKAIFSEKNLKHRKIIINFILSPTFILIASYQILQNYGILESFFQRKDPLQLHRFQFLKINSLMAETIKN